MRALIVDDKAREKIKSLIELATLNPYSLEEVTALAKGFDPQAPETRVARINEDFTIELPVGFTVTYTHEYQSCGLCRHLSVSAPLVTTYPSIAAVQEIMTLFGFTSILVLGQEGAHVWEEKYSPGFSAVNVMEVVK